MGKNSNNQTPVELVAKDKKNEPNVEMPDGHDLKSLQTFIKDNRLD